MRVCQNCSHENDDSHLFCAKCGTKLDDTIQDEQQEVENIDDEIPRTTRPIFTDRPYVREEKKRYCPNCGKSVDLSDNICPFCRERLINTSQIPKIVPTEANIALLLAIIGLLYSICGAFTLTGVVIGIIAIILGTRANNLIKKELVYAGRDKAIAGIVLGSIAIGINIIFLIVLLIMFGMDRFSKIFDESMFL